MHEPRLNEAALPTGEAAFEQARSLFTRGVEAFEAGDLPRAEALFVDALKLVPGRPSALVNLAAVRQRLGRHAQALAALDQALAAAPDDAEAWFHHGELLQVLKRPLEALGSYERVLAIAPTAAAAWTQRGGLLKDMGRLAEAAECFRQALAHGGDAEMNRYFLASVSAGAPLGGPVGPGGSASASPPASPAAEAAAAATAEPPPTAPRRYVQALFDSYAEEFDEHLVGKLGYRTPQLIAGLLGIAPTPSAPAAAQTAGAPRARAAAPRWPAALDLGCGTGLMGPLLRPHCGHADGVDLSPAMLAKAHALGCYRQLVHAEVGEHLAQATERYGLVVAADVFVYIGDLAPVFAGVARVLDAGGLFAFSVEEAAPGVPRYELRASSRYAHAEAYLRDLAAGHGLAVREITRATLRHDQRRPIGGLLVLMEKA